MSEKKGINLAILLGKSGQGDEDDERSKIAAKVLRAVKDDDADALAMALGAFVDCHADRMEDDDEIEE